MTQTALNACRTAMLAVLLLLAACGGASIAPVTPAPTATPPTATSPTAASQTAELPRGFVRYTDAALGLRFAHPATWLTLPDEGAVYLASSEAVVVGESFAEGAAVFIFVLPLAPAAGEEAALSASERLTNFVERFSLLSGPQADGPPETRLINGQEAAQATYRGEYGGVEVQAIYTVVMVDARAAIVVTLTAQPGTFGEQLTAVTNSVELIAASGVDPDPAGPPARFNTGFPLVGRVSNFEGWGGDSPVNYQSDARLAEVLAFYRAELTVRGFTERPQHTVVTDAAFNLTFDSPTSDRALVVQGIALGPKLTNVNLRYEAVE